MMMLYMGIVLFLILATRILAYWGICVVKNGAIEVIPNVVKFSFVENTGAAFGVMKDAKFWLIAISVLLFIVITYYVVYKKKELKLSALISLAMVAGGGISNVADRLQFGYVVDYIDFYCINYPVFNLADICVVVGVFWIAVMILFAKEPKEPKEPEGTIELSEHEKQ